MYPTGDLRLEAHNDDDEGGDGGGAVDAVVGAVGEVLGTAFTLMIGAGYVLGRAGVKGVKAFVSSVTEDLSEP